MKDAVGTRTDGKYGVGRPIGRDGFIADCAIVFEPGRIPGEKLCRE
jgi:hypothetical protein